MVITSVLANGQASRPVSAYLTTEDRSALLERQPDAQQWQSTAAANLPVVTVDDAVSMQTIEGFGFALTGGSAQLIHRMSPTARHKLLVELFGNSGDGIGVSYLRLTIGSSDMNDHVYTYDDMPSGEKDSKLKHFSLREDEADVIPVMQEILQVNPKLKILASPWSAPSWMKDNDNSKGGSLLPEFYPAYAKYFVRYIKGMQRHGITIAELTIQNEPLNPKNTPSMVMESKDEATFIREALGPALHGSHLNTKILAWDHNCNHPEYPLTVLNDPQAGPYVAGSAFHLYEGEISALSEVHDAHPDKDIYFTEQMVIENRKGPTLPVANPVERIVIAATRNWSRTVLLWNLAADTTFGPHTSNGGCPVCQGAITLDGDQVQRNIAFYAIAQVSKFVPPASVRVASTGGDDLGNVAFRTPNGQIALLVTNNSKVDRTFVIAWHQQSITAKLAAGSVATYLW